MIQTALAGPRRQFLIFVIGIICCGGVEAHNTPTRAPSLTAAEVQRVLGALEGFVVTLDKAGVGQTARLPDDAVGMVALVSILPAAVADLDTGLRQTSTSLRNVLTAAGYEASVDGFWQWYTDTERVLLAYEIIDQNLRYENITDANGTSDRSSDNNSAQPQETAARNLDILNAAFVDVDAVRPYKAQLDKFAKRLRSSGR